MVWSFGGLQEREKSCRLKRGKTKRDQEREGMKEEKKEEKKKGKHILAA
jgi:hypothetical protein